MLENAPSHDIAGQVRGTCSPGTWIDIGDTIDDRTEALRKHRSRLDGEKAEYMLRPRGRLRARGHGIDYAEDSRSFGLD